MDAGTILYCGVSMPRIQDAADVIVNKFWHLTLGQQFAALVELGILPADTPPAGMSGIQMCAAFRRALPTGSSERLLVEGILTRLSSLPRKAL